MQLQVLKKWDRIRSSFWFIPTVMAGGAMALAFTSVSRDTQVTDWLELHWGVTFNGGAAGASSLLAAIAGSMITIAGGSILNDFGGSFTCLVSAGTASATQSYARYYYPSGTRYVCGYFSVLFASSSYHTPC